LYARQMSFSDIAGQPHGFAKMMGFFLFLTLLS
jgi:hypothetical protein